jgi:hypothetical protein
MGTWDSYKYEQRPRLTKGKYWVEILEAESGFTKTKGEPKITLVVRPNNANMRIYKTIVKNDWFNSDMSEFFDCFGIEPGNFDFATWVGAIGMVFLDESGKYMEVKRFIPLADTKDGPQWEGPRPERQTVTQIPSAGSYPADDDRSQGAADDDDELPF